MGSNQVAPLVAHRGAVVHCDFRLYDWIKPQTWLAAKYYQQAKPTGVCLNTRRPIHSKQLHRIMIGGVVVHNNYNKVFGKFRKPCALKWRIKQSKKNPIFIITMKSAADVLQDTVRMIMEDTRVKLPRQSQEPNEWWGRWVMRVRKACRFCLPVEDLCFSPLQWH